MQRKHRVHPRRLVAIDTETTGLLVFQGDQPFAVSLCWEDGCTEYFEWPVDPHTRRVAPSKRDLKRLRKLLSDRSIVKVFHNASFDLKMLEIGLGLKVLGEIHDTMIAANVCRSNEPSCGLKALAQRYCDDSLDDERALKAEVKRCRHIASQNGWATHDSLEADYWLPKAISPQSTCCASYAVRDADRTMLLWQHYDDVMNDKPSLRDTYDFEIRLLSLLDRMERRGVRVDVSACQRERKKCQREADKCKRRLCEPAGNPQFNPNSPPQVRRLLFEILGLDVKLWTPKKLPKVSQDALIQYRENETVQTLLKYRANATCITRYYSVFEKMAAPDEIVPGGMCIHTHFHQANAATGRLACSEPNLQGIADAESTRSVNPISARGPFGPRPGYLWILADYSQLEARIFAAASQDAALLRAFAAGRDLHNETANRAWGGENNSRAIGAALESLETSDRHKARHWLGSFDYDIVAAERSLGKQTWRQRGKTILFTRMMGGGFNGIAAKLRCSLTDAESFLAAFDESFPGIRKFLRVANGEALRQEGVVLTLFDRQLDLLPNEYWKAGPYIVQGTAADLIKRRMVACDEYFRKERLDAHIVLTIHDELIFEISEEAVTPRLLRMIQRIMQDHEGRLPVGIPVEFHTVSQRWSEKEKLELPPVRNRTAKRRKVRRSIATH